MFILPAIMVLLSPTALQQSGLQLHKNNLSGAGMFFEAIRQKQLRNKISEWCLLAGGAVVVALFLWLLYINEVRRVEAAERERLQTLTNVIATDISVNLIATDNALNGVIKDYFSGPQKASKADVSRRLRTLEAAMPGVRALRCWMIPALPLRRRARNWWGNPFPCAIISPPARNNRIRPCCVFPRLSPRYKTMLSLRYQR